MPFLPATTGDYFLASMERFMERSRQGRHFGVTVVRLAGPPDLAALNRTWRQLFATHPLLGAKLRRRWRGWQLGWEINGCLDAPPIAVHDEPLAFDDDNDDCVVVQRLSGCRDGASLGTPLLLEVFAGRTVLLTWRHHFVDGIGLHQLISQLAAGAIAPTAEPDAGRAPARSSSLKTALPAMRTLWRITCAGNASAWPRQSPHRAGGPRFWVWEADTATSASAAAACERHCGEVFHLPFFAAVAVRALHRVHRMRGLTGGCCHLEVLFQKGARPPGRLLQNHMSTMPLAIDMNEVAELGAAVRHVMAVWQQALRERLPQASAALMANLMHLPVGLAIPFIRTLNQGEICSLFHSHTGTFLPKQETFAGAAVTNVFTIPAVSAPPGLGVFFSDFAGRLTTTLAWREGCLFPEEQHAVQDQIRADLSGAPGSVRP